jgi:hypothetical protein
MIILCLTRVGCDTKEMSLIMNPRRMAIRCKMAGRRWGPYTVQYTGWVQNGGKPLREREKKTAIYGKWPTVGVKQNTVYCTANGECNGIVYKCWLPVTLQ